MSTIYLVHGFNVKDGGRSTTRTLTRHLGRGINVKQLKYGHVGRMGVRACNDNVAHMLASLVREDDVVVAHSNGASIVHDADQLGMQSAATFLLNPALDKDLSIDGTDFVRVFYSPSDPWTKLAKWIPFSKWGNQGQVGFTGTASPWVDYEQTNNDDLFGAETGHSGIFKGLLRPQVVANIIRSDLNERI